MSQPYIRPTIITDVFTISGDIREADRAEIQAMSGRSPQEALFDGYKTQLHGGTVRTVCLGNGIPVAMYGINPTQEPKVGFVWLLAANGFMTIPEFILRNTRSQIEELTQGYDLVGNLTDARNEAHHRWIRWAGFTFIKEHTSFGAEGRPFYEFVKITGGHHV